MNSYVSLSKKALYLIVWICTVFVPTSASAQAIINDLSAPQSIIANSEKGYLVANANGEPGNRDNKGFISQLDDTGKLTHTHFIQGGKDGTVLNSPTGMVIVGDILYVADIDTIRGFMRTTGESVSSVSMTRFHCSTLTGLTANKSGQLFVSDTATDAIYRIDPAQEFAVSLVVQDEALSGPRGLAIHPHTGRLTGVSWEGGKVFEVSESGEIKELLSNSFFSRRFHNLDGIAFDRYGSMYISDMSAGKVWRVLADLKKQVIAEFLVSPAGIGVDREKHLILVPYLYANGAEINGLEQPSNSGKKRKPRDLSDYGLGWTKKDQPNE
ncbi:MAG: ATP/GTP-binding protein [Nitrospirales bacterium]|nr:MAG: ATP/GTP-binding protein [Nitrospirales bacterium]